MFQGLLADHCGVYRFCVEKEAVKQLKEQLKEDVKASNEKGFLQAAYFLWLTGEYKKAREYAKFVSDLLL